MLVCRAISGYVRFGGDLRRGQSRVVLFAAVWIAHVVDGRAVRTLASTSCGDHELILWQLLRILLDFCHV